MTIREAIDRADALMPNGIERHNKVLWLSELDGRIYEEIVKTHEDAGEWHAYTDETDGMTRLLATLPYDDIYMCWLMMQISFFNNEITRYNNEALRFNAKYADFANHYNSTHMPLTRAFCYYGKDNRTGNGARLIGRRGEKIADPLSE